MSNSRYNLLLDKIINIRKEILTRVEEDYKNAVFSEIGLSDNSTIQDYANKIGIVYVATYSKKYCGEQEVVIFIYDDRYEIKVNNKFVTIATLSEVAIDSILKEMIL